MQQRLSTLGLTSAMGLLTLSGCYGSQTLNLTYDAVDAAPAGGPTVGVVVHDERPYVRNGSKPPYYLGKIRGIVGEPWDVELAHKVAVADVLGRDLVKELRALGYTVESRDTADRVLDVSINDWNLDRFVNGRFWYDVDVRVRNWGGAELAASRVTDAKYISGAIATGVRAHLKEVLPALYADAIHRMVRDSEAIRGALARDSSAPSGAAADGAPPDTTFEP